jgi:hypothetical protein
MRRRYVPVIPTSAAVLALGLGGTSRLALLGTRAAYRPTGVTLASCSFSSLIISAAALALGLGGTGRLAARAPSSARRPVPPKPRARTAAEMISELRLQAVASVPPVRAMGCTRARQCEAALPPTPRARTAAEMMSELRLQARRAPRLSGR